MRGKAHPDHRQRSGVVAFTPGKSPGHVSARKNQRTHSADRLIAESRPFCATLPDRNVRNLGIDLGSRVTT
jgi:hypothetical protein